MLFKLWKKQDWLRRAVRCKFHEPFCALAGHCICGKGGSSTTVIQPSAPPQPSTAEAIDAWVKAMPTVYETQAKYAPMEAQQQYDLMAKYAQPLAQLEQQIQQGLNPETSKIQEQMASQANQGMNATSMPDWMRKQYQSDFNAQLGSNASSPIGADYVSRGMQNQLFNQQKYYRDLGLSLAGRQPLISGATPAATNQMGSFTPQSALNYTSGNYSTFAQASRPLTGQKTESSRLWGLW